MYKTAQQCENKWKNLRRLYLKKKQNKKAISSGQSAFNIEYEEQFDKIYKNEPTMNPVSVAENLIEEENNINENGDERKKEKNDDNTEYPLQVKRKKTEHLNNMYTII